MLHRVGATGLLGGLQHGSGLTPLASPARLMAVLDAAVQLPGLEGLAAECVARLINGGR